MNILYATCMARMSSSGDIFNDLGIMLHKQNNDSINFCQMSRKKLKKFNDVNIEYNVATLKTWNNKNYRVWGNVLCHDKTRIFI